MNGRFIWYFDNLSTGISLATKHTLCVFIAQVYILSAVHCQVTWYSLRVTGYLTRYSVSANEISFGQKISQSDCIFQLMLGQHFQLLLITTLWPRIPEAVHWWCQNNFYKDLCHNTDEVYFAKTVWPAPVFVRNSGSHQFRDQGSVLTLGAGDTVW